ncbi:MAG: fused MFS/spermidine synthase [Planctomycetota bacterium]
MRIRPLCLLLFLSGAATLVLEVAWFRRLAQVAGGTSVALSAVLAAFFGGMAAGAWLLGRFADRAARPLRFYAWLETTVVLCALLSPVVLDSSREVFVTLFARFHETPPLHAVLNFLFAVLLLAPPAFLLGATLPAAAAAARTTPADRGRALGWLYAWNTLGAVVGTVLAGFILLPALGLTWSMRTAALLSGAAALGAFLLKEQPREAGELQGPVGAPHPDAGRALKLYAASGFLGLTAEVAFTRSLVLVFGSATYAFTTMLAVFLFGIGAGGAIGTRLARDGERLRQKLEITVAATAALFSLAALLVYFLPRLYISFYLALEGSFGAGLWTRFVLSSLILLPGALGLGAAFPLAVHLAASRESGAGTGRAYAANALAGIAGTVLSVALLIPVLGPQYTVALAALATALVAAFGARRRLVWGLTAVTALGFIPPFNVARERLLAGVYYAPEIYLVDGRIHEETWEDGIDLPFARYGREATVSVFRWYGSMGVLIDGKAVATNHVVDDVQHLALLGHLPLALHPDPQSVLIVGLGMGTTWKAVTLHEPKTVRVVEIEGAVVEAAAFIGNRPRDVVVADARTYVQATDQLYDVITSDPIHPWVRGGGDLYTLEYFESCRAKLAPGGVACQWLPVHQLSVEDRADIIRTFCAVFQAAAYYAGGDLILVGVATGDVPPPRALKGAALEALRAMGVEDLDRLRVADHVLLVDRVGEGRLLTDDSLHLEFSAPRQLMDQDAAQNYAWTRALWIKPPKLYNAMLHVQEARAAGDTEALTRWLTKAKDAGPGDPFRRRYAGELDLIEAEQLIRYGRTKLAEKFLENARALLPDDPRLIGTEADLRAAEGKHAAAATLYRKLLEKQPGNRYLQRRLKRVTGR